MAEETPETKPAATDAEAEATTAAAAPKNNIVAEKRRQLEK